MAHNCLVGSVPLIRVVPQVEDARRAGRSGRLHGRVLLLQTRRGRVAVDLLLLLLLLLLLEELQLLLKLLLLLLGGG